MIFFADFCEGSGTKCGTALDYRMVVAVLNCTTDMPSPLPAQPRNAMDGQTNVPVVDLVRADATSDWLRNAVVDFRMGSTWKPPDKHYGTKSVNERLTASAYAIEEMKKEEPVEITFKGKILMVLDYPESSVAANRWSLGMGLLILVSVLTLFLEPLVSPKNANPSDDEKAIWLGFEAFFTAIFTVEYIVTLWACDGLGTQTRGQFVKEPMRICDLVAVLPFYIDMAVDADQEEFRLFRIARLMRLSRLMRLGRLAKKSANFAPVAMILVVIWGIYMKNGLKE